MKKDASPPNPCWWVRFEGMIEGMFKSLVCFATQSKPQIGASPEKNKWYFCHDIFVSGRRVFSPWVWPIHIRCFRERYLFGEKYQKQHVLTQNWFCARKSKKNMNHAQRTNPDERRVFPLREGWIPSSPSREAPPCRGEEIYVTAPPDELSN